MRIVVATDGSEPAGQAIALVEAVDWPAGTTIRVVAALETDAQLFGGPWPAVALVQSAELEARLQLEAQTTVREAADRLARPGLTVETTVPRERPATVIVDEAAAMKADLIVLGSRGHGTIESMLLGSVSAEVIDHSPAPVLVARGSRIGRVVLAWDGSQGAERAAELVIGWPIFAGSSVRVVSVSDVGLPWQAGFAEAESAELARIYAETLEASRVQHAELARAMADRLRQAGLTADADPRDGDAASEILAAADAWDAELVVIGTHGRTGLARLLLGSVARNVLHHATCSVMVVRAAPSAATPAAGGV